MRAGWMRHKITIQTSTEAQNDYGEAVQTWATYASPWASIEPTAGREFFDSQQVNAEVTHRIRIRYVVGVTPKMRVVYGSRTFRIESVVNVSERNKEMILMCIEDV